MFRRTFLEFCSSGLVALAIPFYKKNSGLTINRIKVKEKDKIYGNFIEVILKVTEKKISTNVIMELKKNNPYCTKSIVAKGLKYLHIFTDESGNTTYLASPEYSECEVIKREPLVKTIFIQEDEIDDAICIGGAAVVKSDDSRNGWIVPLFKIKEFTNHEYKMVIEKAKEDDLRYIYKFISKKRGRVGFLACNSLKISYGQTN